MRDDVTQARLGNHLLRQLPEEVFVAMRPHLSLRALDHRYTWHSRQAADLSAFYVFPIDCQVVLLDPETQVELVWSSDILSKELLPDVASYLVPRTSGNAYLFPRAIDLPAFRAWVAECGFAFATTARALKWQLRVSRHSVLANVAAYLLTYAAPELSITQDRIGAALDIRRETATEAIRKLVYLGAVDAERSLVRILNHPMLADVASATIPDFNLAKTRQPKELS